MAKYEPAGVGENALVRVVFVVQFAKNFTQDEFRKIDELAVTWRNELPRRSTDNALLFNPANNKATPDPNAIVGLSYEALMKNGNPEFGLRVEQSRIMFLVGEYTHWNEIWPIAKRHLTWAIEQVASQNSIINFSCEYSDLFRYTGEYFDFRSEGFFRDDSDLVPSFIFDQVLNFHFHSGYFTDLKSPDPHRILTRIN